MANDIAPNCDQYPLGKLPKDWEPEEIRCGLLDFELDHQNNIQFFFRPWDSSTLIKVFPGADINAAIQEVRTHAPPVPLVREAETPYDLKVEKRCYIILRLMDRNWYFRSTDAITTKSKHDDIYGGLIYVLANNILYAGERGASERSKIVCFAAIEPPSGFTGTLPYSHGINFHIELDQSNGRTLPLIIDPDVKYPGGNS